MNNRWSLRKQNTGASLLAVLVTMIVVGVIGILITHLTITNIQMKEVESSNKKNFYKAEERIDELTVALNTVAAKCMQDAYMEVLQKYDTYGGDTKKMQEAFTDSYLELLYQAFRLDTAPEENIPEIGVLCGKKSLYDVEKMKTTYLTGSGTDKSWFLTANTPATAGEAVIYVDYTDTKESVRLKNIKVKNNAGDYETTITTDIVFSVPQMNFGGRNLVTEYMKYALIADNKISVNASNVTVDGNVYAGVGGIDVLTGTSGNIIAGNVIVTRGDIASSGGMITIGKADASSQIWAENVCTTSGSGNILLQGNSYIADDLALNARGSTIKLKGKYYGYNFRENYPDTLGATATNKNADFSSALMINARSTKDASGNVVKNSYLNIKDLDYLLVAGRTYISSGNSGNDIPMGESVSVRSNQLAYFVDESYLEKNPDGTVKNNMFSAAGVLAYANDTGVSDFTNYLDSSKQVIGYSFIDNAAGGTTHTYYYLNFKSEDDANEFYLKYVNSNKASMDEQAEEYLASTSGRVALELNHSTVLTLRGDLLYREGTTLKEKMATTTAVDWDIDTSYWNFAKMLAIRYKSLQTSLTETGSGITGTDVRFTTVVGASTVIDKSVDPLFENIVKKVDVENDFTKHAQTVFSDPSTTATVVFVNNQSETSSYTVPTNTKGIVVATGDVYVEDNFEGMIIAGGTVTFGTNATLTANSVLVSELFRKASKSTVPSENFTKYFHDYATLLENVIGTVEIADYLSLENWQKN